MKRLLLSGVLSLALSPFAALLAQSTNVYINSGSVSFAIDAVPIDAVTFINSGTFSAISLQPYETFDTLNFTNKGTGTMNGIPGFWFDDSPSRTGQRQWSANFFNDNNGVVTATSFADFGILVTGFSVNMQSSYLQIWATNIVNYGTFNVGAGGVIQMTGDNVDLKQGVFDVTALAGVGSVILTATNQFSPDTSVYDVYWAAANFTPLPPPLVLDTAAIWDGTNATAPSISSPPAGPPPIPILGFSFVPTYADSWSNYVTTAAISVTNVPNNNPMTVTLVTNMTKEAVFVSAPAFVTVTSRFSHLGISNFNDINVLLSMPLTNSINRVIGTNYIYFQDLLANQAAVGLVPNSLTPDTFRPTNYLVDRLPHATIFVPTVTSRNGILTTNPPSGFSGKGVPEPNFFLESGNISFVTPSNVVSSDTVQPSTVVSAGAFAAYAAFLDNVASRPPPVAGGTITNLPGSIRIAAVNLDMTGAKLRAEGQVSITAENLISSTNASIDCENLSYELGSSSGNLVVQNLASIKAGRLRGEIRAWSATWTNAANVVIPNNFDTNGIPVPLTNGVSMGCYALILDASGLLNALQVSLYNLILHSTHITVNDDLTVIQSLLIDGQTFTLNGGITIPGFFPPADPINNVLFPGVPLQNWTGTNAPTLALFTNNGAFFIYNEAHFGDDRPLPYAVLVNSGNIIASGIKVNSTYFENDGNLIAQPGTLIINCGSGKLQNSTNTSGNFAKFTAGSLQFSNSAVLAGDSLSFSVTNRFTDGGSSNLFQAMNGINLLTKPQTGDLLGSTLLSIAPSTVIGKTVTHTWAGEDRGANPAGYYNNAAVGTLTFNAFNANSVFSFAGTAAPGRTNGLYVDVLDLSGLNSTNQLQINPNLVIYFAAAKVNFTPPTNSFGLPQQPEEFLNGQLGGHLRWVSSFAGPGSSTNVVIGGQTNTVNRALAGSHITTNLQTAPLVVTISGSGTITPNNNGKSLLLGQTYGMIASPASGSKFIGWTIGSSNTTSPQLTFVMQSNLTIVATFTFAPAAASFSGLFYETNGIEFLKSGAVTLTTTKAGNYTGNLQIGAKRYPFSGLFNSSGTDTRPVPNSGGLVLQLQAGNDQILGTVSNALWTASLQADRAVFNSRTNKATAFAGRYTLIFPGSSDPADTNNPQGDGFGTVTVNTSGQVALSGTLADGTKISQTATLSGDGLWPLYVPLYSGKGQLLSWQTFAITVDQDISGLFSWIKQTNTAAKLYPNGFSFENTSVGSAYNPQLVPVTGFTNANVLLTGGNLAGPIANTVTVTTKNKVINVSGSKLTLTLTPSQGLFKGSVLNANTGKSVSFTGALLQKQLTGSGYFLGTNQSGHVSFSP